MVFDKARMKRVYWVICTSFLIGPVLLVFVDGDFLFAGERLFKALMLGSLLGLLCKPLFKISWKIAFLSSGGAVLLALTELIPAIPFMPPLVVCKYILRRIIEVLCFLSGFTVVQYESKWRYVVCVALAAIAMFEFKIILAATRGYSWDWIYIVSYNSVRLLIFMVMLLLTNRALPIFRNLIFKKIGVFSMIAELWTIIATYFVAVFFPPLGALHSRFLWSLHYLARLWHLHLAMFIIALSHEILIRKHEIAYRKSLIQQEIDKIISKIAR